MLFDFDETGKEKKVQDKLQKRDEAKLHCGHLVNAIVEELLRMDERKSRNPSQYDGNNVIALISTLYALSQNLPALLVKHIDTLLVRFSICFFFFTYLRIIILCFGCAALFES